MVNQEKLHHFVGQMLSDLGVLPTFQWYELAPI
jgi:hypothetical protein